MTRIARPVLDNLSRRKLHSTLPLDFHAERSEFAMLEAFGRTLCGIAPWLEAEGLEGEEKELQHEFAGMALKALDAATDPQSPDFMVFDHGGQPLVDAAFLSHALVRAPKTLIGGLDQRVKDNLVRALRSSRKITPGPSNWIFFSAMVEAALFRLGAQDYDMLRVSYAARAFMDWYQGDGLYGDASVRRACAASACGSGQGSQVFFYFGKADRSRRNLSDYRTFHLLPFWSLSAVVTGCASAFSGT